MKKITNQNLELSGDVILKPEENLWKIYRSLPLLHRFNNAFFAFVVRREITLFNRLVLDIEARDIWQFWMFCGKFLLKVPLQKSSRVVNHFSKLFKSSSKRRLHHSNPNVSRIPINPHKATTQNSEIKQQQSKNTLVSLEQRNMSCSYCWWKKSCTKKAW